MFRIHMLRAEDGDCLLVETGDPTCPHRILIDGGRQGTLPAILDLIASLPPRTTPAIDLMVLTHVDADHIEGLLAYIADASTPPVGELWFNGLDHVRVAAGKKQMPGRPPMPTIQAKEPKQKVLSIRQAAALTEAVAGRGWPWNAAFHGGPIMTVAGATLPVCPLPAGGRIVLLGPPQKKLAAVVDEWEATFNQLLQKKTDALSGGERAIPTPETLADLAKRKDKADTSRPNGCSITFVIEQAGRRVLFAADAHPGDLTEALGQYDQSAGRIAFDAIKVAHHGSAANNTSSLIDRLESPVWLVSSDGSRHGHPDPEAIARIVLAGNPGKRIVFNYHSIYNQSWSNADLASSFRYLPEFQDENFTLEIT